MKTDDKGWIDRLSNKGLCDKYFQKSFPKYISNRPHSAKNCMFRNNEVNLLKDELEAGNNLLIYGEGGYGKTSLISKCASCKACVDQCARSNREENEKAEINPCFITHKRLD